ncbi:hypothetical protein ACFC1T_14605 [Kitasatospora sp. NPDC056076]|uniref:hypothetical protein n=1 Tax=Kitasatospora sp. NPDC056076 TaxID=3345703 RepID=UPI0035D565EF
MTTTNDPKNNAFYEQRWLDIHAAFHRGNPSAAADLTVTTVSEGEFTGPDATDNTLRALNAAAVRMGLSSDS